MKTPFTIEQFFDVFRKYNEAVFPMQLLLSLLAVWAVYLAIRPASHSNTIISGILGFLWLYMGIVYHLIFFSKVNPAAYAFAAMFIIQGSVWLAAGVFHDTLSFRFRADGYGITGISLIVFALILYPLFGYALGHVYPAAPSFGLPCPTTIFSFGLLLLTRKRIPVLVLAIPFIWSVTGFTAAYHFGMLEDTALLIAGLLTIPMLVLKNRNQQRVEK